MNVLAQTLWLRLSWDAVDKRACPDVMEEIALGCRGYTCLPRYGGDCLGVPWINVLTQTLWMRLSWGAVDKRACPEDRRLIMPESTMRCRG